MRNSDESDGFTLVELLVVVVIIGIIAAIAIPNLLNQRQRAFDGAAVSDLRNLVAVETGLLSETGSFTQDPDALDDDWAASDSVVVCALTADEGQSLSLASWHLNGGTVYSWSSDASLTSAAAVPLPSDCDGAIAPGATEVS